MKTLRWLAVTLVGMLLMLLALGGALWIYGGSDNSLATTLRWLTPLLPAGQRLELQDVRGSVRQGGRIGAVHWEHNGLQVHAQDVTLRWQPEAIFRRELRLTELTIGQLRIDDQRPTTTDAPPAPPTQLGLPFTVDAQVRIDALEWVRSTTQRVEQITFNYIFDSYSHRLEKGQSLFYLNKYDFSGSLQTSAPMALSLQASGQVTAPVPGGAALTLAANATLKGDLADRESQLTLQAELTPQTATNTAAKHPPAQPGNAMQASLSAQLAPWQSQPVRSAQARWQALDLSRLWPQAPYTRLDGQASVAPQDARWQATVRLTNTASGPWNQQRLPIQSLQAELDYTDGRWLVRALQAQGAGGSVTATAQLNQQASWQLHSRLQGIDPAAVDTRLDGAALSGTLSAQQSLGTDAAHRAPMVFALDLHATPPAPGKDPAALQTLQLHSLIAKGSWLHPKLTLSTLQIDAKDAQLQGLLQIHTVNRAVQGQLALHLPGLSASVQGHLSGTDGQGSMAVQVNDAERATQWFARWPQIAQRLGQQRWFGQANLSGQWHGGWQNQASALQLVGQLRAAQLGWSSTNNIGNKITLRNVQLDLSGSPVRFTLNSQGQVATRGRQLDWRNQAHGARLTSGVWQASVGQLQLALHQDNQTKDLWRLALDTPTAKPTLLTWQPGNGAGQWALSAGSAKLQGPVAGSSLIRWQAMDWSPTAWQSQGQVDALPLVWLDALTRKSLSDLGLHTDMLLSGQWQVSQTRSLQASITLERSSGDLFLQSGDHSKATIAAAMREAWLQVNLNEGQMSASMRWDSVRAGKALLAFSTRVQSASGEWSWNDKEPVAGSVQLQLPPMDVWSALAPPGWRLRGTVNTHIDLGGTLDEPQWSGSLQARDLALRSVVDGIDFSQGRLDATLHGQQLDLTTFTLRGAGTGSGKSDGGQLSLRGSVFWRPDIGGSALKQQIEMQLQAELQGLRLSTRPDRRLVTSGKLLAHFKDGTLTLRGALSADQALFTLPDDDTPSLGDDVQVRQSQPAAAMTKVTTASRLPVDVAVDLNLGPDFRVRGRGMDTRLVGKLTLSANAAHALALNGNVRSVKGSYRAYGQKLDIERGVLRFTGPVDNPALDILAIRPQLSQRVGVQISGTALVPVIALYADPDLPDAEKLAWLVLGRSAGEGGAEAALMQQAAMALLGGNGKGLSESLGSALGLDELSFRGGSDTGTGTATEASVALGKRLSSKFYVAYERSLNSAIGVFSIFYDLSKRLTLRAQTGEQSHLDLIYTLRYD